MIAAQNETALSRDQASLLGMMANATRLTILKLLLENEYCVQELAVRVGLSENATSMHLAKLRRARMVLTSRRAQNIYYSFNPKSPATAVLKLLRSGGSR